MSELSAAPSAALISAARVLLLCLMLPSVGSSLRNPKYSTA